MNISCYYRFCCISLLSIYIYVYFYYYCTHVIIFETLGFVDFSHVAISLNTNEMIADVKSMSTSIRNQNMRCRGIEKQRGPSDCADTTVRPLILIYIDFPFIGFIKIYVTLNMQYDKNVLNHMISSIIS